MSSVQRLPPSLRSFLFGTIGIATLCIGVVSFCRFILRWPYPYKTPFLDRISQYSDFTMFFGRFHSFHSTAFFTVHAMYIFSYPAPMAVLYKLSYVLTGESAVKFVLAMTSTFALTAFLFGRAMLRAGVSLSLTILFTGISLLFSDPIWFELNRANLEFFVWVFLTLGVWLFLRGNSYGAAACFGIAGAMKLFPFVYLGLLIARKQYRQVVFALLVAAFVTLGSLWIVCPDVGLAWHTLNLNMNSFGRYAVLQRRWPDLWYDHSLFALIKILWFHLPGPATMSKFLSAYMVVVAAGGTALFFLRIRLLPVANQVLCLVIASILLCPTSGNYTLIHLYAPWAMLVFLAIHAARQRQDVPGLGSAFICFAILLSAENEIFVAHQRISGAIKAVALIALWYVALRYPLQLSPNSQDRADMLPPVPETKTA